MRKIDHRNCEEWFFEYFEGNLSKEEEKWVMEFISKDPLCKEEFESWEKTYIRAPLPPRLAIEKSLLKKDYSSYLAFGFIALLPVLVWTMFLPSDRKNLATGSGTVKESGGTRQNEIYSGKDHKDNSLQPNMPEKKVLHRAVPEDKPEISYQINNRAIHQDTGSLKKAGISLLQQDSSDSTEIQVADNHVQDSLNDFAKNNGSVTQKIKTDWKKKPGKDEIKYYRKIKLTKHLRQQKNKNRYGGFSHQGEPYVVPVSPNF